MTVSTWKKVKTVSLMYLWRQLLPTIGEKDECAGFLEANITGFEIYKGLNSEF